MTAGLALLTDDELVDRAQSGNPRAFEVLLRRHEKAMFRTSMRLLGQRSDVEDVLQDAFLASWRQLPEFRAQSAFGTWLYRIVINRSLNQRRGRKTSEELEPDEQVAAIEQVTPGARSPSGEAEQSALMDALRQALQELPEPLRVCWVLRELEERSYEEIAVIVNASEPTVRGRISRARTRLAQAMATWR